MSIKKPFYLRKRGNKQTPRKDWIVQFAWSSTKPLKWLSIKKILRENNVDEDTISSMMTSKKKCEAWLLDYFTDEKKQEQHRAIVAEQQAQATGSTTFEDYTRDWYVPGKCHWLDVQINIKKKTLKKSYIQMKRGHLENHFWPEFGQVPINQITKTTIESALAKRNLSTQTIKHMLGTLTPIFDDAEERDLLKKHPLRHLDISKVTHQQKGIFTPAEIKQLWPTDREKLVSIWGEFRVAFFYWLKFSGGLRLGEVIAAKWDQFEWETGLFHLTRTINSDRELSDVTKSGEQRCIILPWATIEMARQWRALTPCPADSDFVFFGSNTSQPADKDNMQKKFKPALEQAGIVPGSRTLTPHSLRHTYKTLLADRITKVLLDRMMGHRSQDITAMDAIYIHKTPREKVLPFIAEQSQIDQVFSL